ncbi:hypothetical protein SDC9_169719 [bioreactor metagenome]|uniref:Uncharacterized protein n=1 Tax=bioreactor metagenome TaxID=1076179 RepID=A0A645G879_9ZZZZ
MQVTIYFYEALLHDIFRILHVAANPVGDSKRHILISIDKVRERGSIARKHLLHTLIFVHRNGLFLIGFFLLLS